MLETIVLTWRTAGQTMQLPRQLGQQQDADSATSSSLKKGLLLHHS
jgi:hypothetical protein